MNEDLSVWKPCPRPENVALDGRFVRVETYNQACHAESLWDALGSSATNELIYYFPNGPYKGAEDFGAWLEAENESGSYHTVIFRRAGSGEVLGMASYMRMDPANGVIEVGAVAHGPQMARSPIATQAHYMMARYVFEELGYRRYEWKLNNDNQPSHRAALRLGFTFEGVFRQHIVSKGKNRDTAWYAMIDKDWPKIKSAFEQWLDRKNFDDDGAQIKRLEDFRDAS